MDREKGTVALKGDPQGMRILAVDDDRFYLKILCDLIEGLGYDYLGVANGHEALEKVHGFRPDIIISDVVMPGMDGIELTKRLKEDPYTTHIPVIMLTSLTEKGPRVMGLEVGANEFLTKPIDETELQIRIRNLIKVKRYEDFLLEQGKTLEGEVREKKKLLEEAYQRIRTGYTETVYRLTLAAEYRDRETGSHIKRISLYSQLLARVLGLSEKEAEAIFFASPMHDVGKIGIPDSILLKEGRHNEEEREIMKTHTLIGGDILKDPDYDILKTAREIALTHHESWDGSGYPMGYKGEETPISGRIVHIVDVYDALRSKRPYKPALSHEVSLEEIEKEKHHFDPEVYRAFTEYSGEMKRLFDENQG